MVAIYNAAGKELQKEGDWVILTRLAQFSSVAGQASYDLPDDFHHLIIDTVWDRSMLTPMKGPISPQMWQTIKSGLIGTGIYFRRWRIVRDLNAATKKFTIDPTPTTAEDMVFEYVSNGWNITADSSEVTRRLMNDTDLPLVDDGLMRLNLKWRWLRAKGFPFQTELAEYNEMLDTLKGQDRPQPGVHLDGPVDGQAFLGYFNIPDTGYGQ